MSKWREEMSNAQANFYLKSEYPPTSHQSFEAGACWQANRVSGENILDILNKYNSKKISSYSIEDHFEVIVEEIIKLMRG